jgi:uracil-DNA glycosylase
MRPWLIGLGASEEDIDSNCHFIALIGEFPGSDSNGHRPPSKEQVHEFRPTLIRQLQQIGPELVVPVGNMAIREVIEEVGSRSLIQVIGQVFTINPFECLEGPVPVVALPHPSGRSTWPAAHPELTKQALGVLGDYLLL